MSVLLAVWAVPTILATDTKSVSPFVSQLLGSFRFAKSALRGGRGVMTNIIATIVIALSTNIYHPRQFKETRYHPTFPVTVVEEWRDASPDMDYEAMGFEIRENPDVRITEVRRKRELVFTFEGKEYRIVLSDTVVSRKEERRTVTEAWSSEPLNAAGGE